MKLESNFLNKIAVQKRQTTPTVLAGNCRIRITFSVERGMCRMFCNTITAGFCSMFQTLRKLPSSKRVPCKTVTMSGMAVPQELLISTGLLKNQDEHGFSPDKHLL